MKVLAITSALLAGGLAEPIPKLATRDTPTIDLGYSVYSGTFDAKNNINVFKGYATGLSRAIEFKN